MGRAAQYSSTTGAKEGDRVSDPSDSHPNTPPTVQQLKRECHSRIELVEPIWERQPKESSDWFRRFCCYRNQIGKRSSRLLFVQKQPRKSQKQPPKSTSGSWKAASPSGDRRSVVPIGISITRNLKTPSGMSASSNLAKLLTIL